MIHQVVTAALRFGVALELTYCIFGAFPAAAMTARRVMLVILVITAGTAMSLVDPERDVHARPCRIDSTSGLGRRLDADRAGGLLLWYRLPLAPLPRAILMGYAPYLLIFTIGMSLLFDSGMQHLRPWVGWVNTAAFLALIIYWSAVAWRTAPEATAELHSGGGPARQAS